MNVEGSPHSRMMIDSLVRGVAPAPEIKITAPVHRCLGIALGQFLAGVTDFCNKKWRSPVA